MWIAGLPKLRVGWRKFVFGGNGKFMMKLLIYMKIIYVNCGVNNLMKNDHRSYIRNFCSCEKKA